MQGHCFNKNATYCPIRVSAPSMDTCMPCRYTGTVAAGFFGGGSAFGGFSRSGSLHLSIRNGAV